MSKSKDEIFQEKRQAVSDIDLIEKCHSVLSELCKTGGRSFTMTVPCRIDDTDMLFGELLRRFKNTVKCSGNCGANYCDEHGCVDNKQVQENNLKPKPHE